MVWFGNFGLSLGLNNRTWEIVLCHLKFDGCPARLLNYWLSNFLDPDAQSQWGRRLCLGHP